MTPVLAVLCVAIGLVPATLLAWKLNDALQQERSTHMEFTRDSAAREAALRESLAAARAGSLTDDQAVDAFRSLSSQVLQAQSSQFLDLAEAKYGALAQHSDQTLGAHAKTVESSLKALGEKLEALERERSVSVTALGSRVDQLTSATAATREEAAKLSAALRDNRVRGMWGEVQLRRALELAGMDRHVDFVEQHTVSGGGATGRPDAIVALPGGRCVVIDSKVPLEKYLAAVDSSDAESQHALLAEHARSVAGHVGALAGRRYEDLTPGSVDMVLMFLPGEPFLAAALDADPALFEKAADKGIYLVTPSSLVPLLRGIALGWREHQADRAAAEIHQLGVELHDRIALFVDRYEKVGVNLERTVKAFNDSVGSLDRRLVPAARRLAEYGASSTKTLGEPSEVDLSPRRIALATSDAPTGALALGTEPLSDGDTTNDLMTTTGAPLGAFGSDPLPRPDQNSDPDAPVGASSVSAAIEEVLDHRQATVGED